MRSPLLLLVQLLLTSNTRALFLPRAALPHARIAEEQLLRGAPAASVLKHVDTAVSLTEGKVPAVLDMYKRLLRLSRQSPHASLPSELIAHLYGCDRVVPDAATAHLAVNALVHHCCSADALGLLRSFHERQLPLTAGSFDLLIQEAAKQRDRAAAYSAYRLLRRCQLTPTAFTLNALLKVETRCGRPLVALRLLERAEHGAPRWPGARPDSWSYSAAMTAAKHARRFPTVIDLFENQRRAARALGQGQGAPAPAVLWNLAIEARLRLRDKTGALGLLQDMRDGKDGAPPPGTDTYNSMLTVLGERGEPFAWVLHAMAADGMQPDEWTLCILLKLQPTLRAARGVWRWGRKRTIPTSSSTCWEHFCECHIRLGRPDRVASLLALMEARDGLRADQPRSHNLYLRALLAQGRPHAALSHFERMCAADAGAAAAGEAAGAAGASDAPKEADVAANRASEVDSKRWAWQRLHPPAPDAHSFSLALTALRQTSATSWDDVVMGAGLAYSQGTEDALSAERARRAAAMADDAEARGLIPADAPPPAAVAHALVCACGADVGLALALWKRHLRPKVLAARQRSGGAPAYALPNEPPTAEQSAYHALLRVCGLAGKAEEALRIVYAMRRDGLPADERWDVSCFRAYERGKALTAEQEAARRARDDGRARPKRRSGYEIVARSGSGLLQSGYETLLKMELCPELIDGPRLGNIEKIRIVF